MSNLKNVIKRDLSGVKKYERVSSMVISRIMIDQQSASIGINTTNAQINITMPRPDMRVNSSLPSFKVNNEDPAFKMDFKSWRSQVGYKPAVELVKDAARKGREKWLEGTAKAAREGDFIADLTIPGNRIAMLSRQNSLEDNREEINLGLMPKEKPAMQWSIDDFELEWTDGKFGIDWSGTDRLAEVSVSPRTSVSVFLKDRNYIRISAVSENIGGTIDAKR